MVVYELVKWLFETLAATVGLHGLAIGVLAALTLGLWYLREAADVLVVVARYARVGSIVGAFLLVALVLGQATGVLELNSGGSLIGQLLDALGGVFA